MLSRLLLLGLRPFANRALGTSLMPVASTFANTSPPAPAVVGGAQAFTVICGCHEDVNTPEQETDSQIHPGPLRWPLIFRLSLSTCHLLPFSALGRSVWGYRVASCEGSVGGCQGGPPFGMCVATCISEGGVIWALIGCQAACHQWG